MYYNNFQTNQYQQPQYFLKGRPVSSLDEARAANIDFDGSLFVFPDVANKKIYTKQIGSDGMSIFNMYELKPIPPIMDSASYITREEFNAAVESIKQSFESAKEQKENFNF